MITAKIIADSVCTENGKRITSFLLTYPRFIHSEFMTHRMFSRNAASSRAIPLKKMIEVIPKVLELVPQLDPERQAAKKKFECD